MTYTHVRERYFEIDLFRGIAVIMMVLFHLLFDLTFFSLYPVEVSYGFWKYFAIVTASSFLLLVGISLTISAANAEMNLNRRDFYLKYLFRGIGILLIAGVITIATWLYLGEGFIIFGILHLIGISIIISPFFLHRGKKTLIMGILCIAIGLFLQQFRGPFWLLPLGVFPSNFVSVDYTPLFPWFGLVLAGIFLGELLYPGGKRGFVLPQLPSSFGLIQYAGKGLSFLGRHSLLIYIIHQPILILLLHPPL